jgi:hypothetical protein
MAVSHECIEERKMNKDRKVGELLHAKHALMPNSLGYCGPDENGRILEHLRSSSTSEGLLSTLSRFEAAYPFIRMIAKSTGRRTFDYEVAEAYWIGNRLLDSVKPSHFFEFAHQGLASPLKKEDAKTLFRELGPIAKPHHTFYVLGMYSRSGGAPANQKKLLQLMESCRISWGKVLEVGEKRLTVESSQLTASGGQLGLSRPMAREIGYDREIWPFEEIKTGDWVSIHWNFASERLTRNQLRNIRKYTALDIQVTNAFVDLLHKEKLLPG